IFNPTGNPVDDSMFERADELEVQAVSMKVMALEDVMVTKLLALREHQVDYESVLEIARALREQIDWDTVWRQPSQSPYARAFFHLAEELGILDERRAARGAFAGRRLSRRPGLDIRFSASPVEQPPRQPAGVAYRARAERGAHGRAVSRVCLL